MTVGCRQNLRPNCLFDPVFYSEQYPEYSATYEFPHLHYQEKGVFEGKYPCSEVAALPDKPIISILTPVYNTDELLLRKCIHSVLYQAYPHWELCLVDDCSSKVHVRKVLEEYAALDSRIKVRFMGNNKGIAAASSEAAAMANGEFVGFLDHDDELTLDALYEIVREINEKDPDVIYTDEDLVNLESRYLESFYKPDYNPELLLCHNYITHFLLTRRQCFTETGGLSGEYSGAQDYDLSLKLVEKGNGAIHIPKTLYHWRAHATSTSVNHEQKQYANEAGRKALAAALSRRGIKGEAENTELKFFYRTRHELADKPKISVICSNNRDDKPLAGFIRHILETTDYGNFEILLPGQDDKDVAIIDQLSDTGAEIRLVDVPGEITGPKWRNMAADEAEGEYIVFLNHALQITTREWLKALLEYAGQDATGFAGGRIDSAGSEYQHQGTIPDLNNTSWYYYVSFVRDVSVHLNGMHCPQNVIYVPEMLCMIRRDKFLDAGGYDDSYSTSAFAGLDLCLRLSDRGMAQVFTPYSRAEVKGVALQSYIESCDPIGAESDKRLFAEKWYDRLASGDPYYNMGVLAERKIAKDTFLKWYTGETV